MRNVLYDHLSPPLGARAGLGAARNTGWQGRRAGVETSSVEEQLRDLFVVLREPVYRYLCGVLGNRAEAGDLTQEAFMRLHHGMRKGDVIENYRAWVFRVAHNLAVNSCNHSRRNSTDPRWDGGSLRSPCRNAEEDILEREKHAERQAWFSAALAKLSPQERQCLELRAEGLRYREIAGILGLRVPTVQTFLARAMNKMVKPGVRE